MKFKDSVIMVTGAGSGIGNAVARKFASEGATLCVCDINPQVLESLEKDMVKNYGIRCLSGIVDVASREDVNQFVHDALEKFGRVDVLVNCAGIFKKKNFFDISINDWYQMIAVHLHGTFLFTKYVAESMKHRGKGCIINIGSTSGLTGGTSGSHYAAAKGGIIAFTKSLGKELAPYGIRVNALAPSKIQTNMLKFDSKSEEEELKSKIPLGRLGMPEEIAEIIAFLASKESEYIVGEVIVASGGY